jgi:hypothetical protein
MTIPPQPHLTTPATGRSFIAQCGLLCLAGTLGFTPCRAQSFDALRSLLSDDARSQGFGSKVQGLAGFGAVPGISGAHFKVDSSGAADDTDLSRMNFPLSYDFKQVGGLQQDLHTELALGWLSGSTDYRNLLPGTPFNSDVSSDLSALSAVGGLGLVFPLTDELTLTPMVLLGYSRVEDDSTFSGPGAATLDGLTRQILFNYSVDELLYGAALELNYKHALAGDIDVQGKLRYNQLFADTLDASDPALEGNGNFGVLTAFVQFDGPTPAKLFGRDLRWIGFAANSTFFGDSADALGFDYFFELGGGIELVDRTVLKGVEGVSLRGSALLGNGVTGWSIGAQLEF